MIRKSQQGVALLIVLLIMALMTTVAVRMASRMFANLNRVESQLRYQQAYWYAQSVESLVRYGIGKSINNEDHVTLSQFLSLRYQIYPIDRGQATSSVFDRQACFNVNSLRDIKPTTNGTNPFLVDVLQQLIESQDIDSFEAETAAASTWEYIDIDTTVQSRLGVEDSKYEVRQLAHVIPNGFMADISEWRAVNGVSQEMFEKVSPFLCALPNSKLVLNVNSLLKKDTPLLTAMFYPNLSDDQAKQLISGRNTIDGWKNIASFMTEPALIHIEKQEKKRVLPFFEVQSVYFELDTKITIDSTTLRMRVLLKRNKNGTVTVTRRRFGGMSERNPDNQV
ncbi:type II secretion system minor pseudopilin GspK [Candidatus Enterovibrio escicola]|uniref:type II secretion system minor pseudopilin GspK n=1 Tax=Candidatus Enterovibrio escicola TaxID=1927127 RepID=UPI001237D595|nr:type II secretion system minor pseudopilin GspK [Candidatus Enterovibrio escacola]